MLNSIVRDIRQQFDYGNKITQLIIVNVAVFILLNFIRLGFKLFSGFGPSVTFDDILRLVSANGDALYTVTHPWVIITHMFVHIGFWHILFNMLFLYWFGRIVGDMIGDKRIIPLYFMSGLFGILIFLLSAPLIGAIGVPAHGASAAVMGFVMAAGLLSPEYNMRLLLIGDVKLKYIVLAVILLDLFSLGGLDNTGGHIAHLGGAAFGAIYITLLRRGRDMAEPMNQFAAWVSRRFVHRSSSIPRRAPRSKVFVRHRSAQQGRESASREATPREQQERLDAILDKIKENGYDNLTPEEKEFLFQVSKK